MMWFGPKQRTICLVSEYIQVSQKTLEDHEDSGHWVKV